MRPENEWFKPEQLTQYYYAAEALALGVVAVGVGVLAVSGVLFAVNDWVVVVGGGVALAGFAFLTWWIRAFYRTADYRLGEEELEYRRGVFFRQRTAVPYNRITNVDASQGPLQRFVGAGTVGVHTAGFGGQTGAELSVTGVSDYEEIKDQILGKVRRRRPESTEGDDAVETGRAGGEVGSESGELLAELRRIRELLEGGRTA
jgi:membrane protein YdbS with pleckstrin-like domain